MFCEIWLPEVRYKVIVLAPFTTSALLIVSTHGVGTDENAEVSSFSSSI